MNLKDYAKENEMTLDEAKKATGLTHWKQEVEETVSAEEIVTEIAEEVVEKSIETKSKKAKVTVDDVRALQTGAGYKTRAYLKAVNQNKKDIPEEYKLVKHLIERYL